MLKVSAFLCLVVSTLLSAEPHEDPGVSSRSTTYSTQMKGYGIKFSCTPDEIRRIKADLVDFFRAEGMQGKSYFTMQESSDGRHLEYTLNTGDGDTDTLNIRNNPLYEITDSSETYTDQRGRRKTVQFASKKEIILSMMARGRQTTYSGKACNSETVLDDIGMRQNISRWGARAWFYFPENTVVQKNLDYWEKGEWGVKPGKSVSDAIADAFTGPIQYGLACTKAVQFIVAQGILDYQKNIKRDLRRVAELEEELGQYPMGRLAKWGSREGVAEVRQYNIPWNNWVPGDWGWIKNDDPASSEEFGMEGSNIVYVGHGMLGVYYDDQADRSVDDALLRVYNWRDRSKRENISTSELLKRIRKDTSEGGMLRNVRDIPRQFSLND